MKISVSDSSESVSVTRIEVVEYSLALSEINSREG